MRRIAWVCVLLGVAAGRLDAAVPTPAARQEHPIALVGGRVHTVSGAVLPSGTVLFDQGRIMAVGLSPAIPAGTECIDVSGKDVYPSLFDPFSRIGLTEIDQVRSTLDLQEVGNITPNVRAQVAVNPESELIPVTRSGGVLLALTAPQAGLIGGTSAVLMLDGWTWGEMTLAAPVALHVTWPTMTLDYAPSLPDSVKQKQQQARTKALRDLKQAFDEARAYRTARRSGRRLAPKHQNDQRWEAMIPVLEGKLPVIVEADEIQQIQAAIGFAAEEKVRLILLGGYDAPRCAALLKRYDVPVIVSDIHRLPLRRGDAYDDPFTLPERLRQEGIRFCIANGGGAWNERNLPYAAATAVAYGLPADEGLKAVTLYPAQILGVADRVGSIDVGKDATLIVTNGDPLDTGSHVERAFIRGRQIDLNDRQKTLYEKYREKYRREKSAQSR